MATVFIVRPPRVMILMLIALCAMLRAVPASALTVTIIPRSTEPEPVTTAAFVELTDGEVDIKPGTGAPELLSSRGATPATSSVSRVEVTTGSVRSSAPTTGTTAVKAIARKSVPVKSTRSTPPTTSTTGRPLLAREVHAEGGFFEGSVEFPGAVEFSESNFSKSEPSFFASEPRAKAQHFSGPAQVPSGGAPSGGASGIPSNGWGSGLPSGVIEGPGGGLHGSAKLAGYDQGASGDVGRSTHVVGGHSREDGMLSYEHGLAGGVQLRAQGSLRQTADREIVSDGNQLRFEGQFVEFGRPTDFLIRAGDITPQFSTYSFSKSGDGVLALKNYERKDGVLQMQVFAARTQREKDPGAFLRSSTGLRAARVWKLGNEAAHVGIGASRVGVREDLSTIAPEAAATTLGFPTDSINSLNYFVDTRQGFHMEGELARSNSEQLTGATALTRRGGANRQSMGYTRSGKNITVEHERIEPTFDAIDAGATLDIDRQSVFVTVPLSPKFTVTTFFQRVYNDVVNQLGRTGENKTFNVALVSQPYAGSKNKYLMGLNLGLIGTFSKSFATDVSTDRFDRDYTWSISNTIRRLTASYSLRAADNVDFVSAANSRRPNHSNYQIGYEIPGGRNNYWKLQPFANLGHDHDLNVVANLVDRSNEDSFGFNGSYGPRATFSVHRDERVQRNLSSDRLSLVDSWHGEFNYQLHPKRDIKGQVLYVSQVARDSKQATLDEDKLLFSIFRSW